MEIKKYMLGTLLYISVFLFVVIMFYYAYFEEIKGLYVVVIGIILKVIKEVIENVRSIK